MADREGVMTSPAEALRSAAGLMREKASAATPGPWRPVAGIWEGETFYAVIGARGAAGRPATWLMATGRNAVSQEANADYAASVHPLVGLALADLLESAAGCGRGEGDDHWPEKARALAIARLVLGEAETGTAPAAEGRPEGEGDGEYELAAILAAHPGATFPELARAVLADGRFGRLGGGHA